MLSTYVGSAIVRKTTSVRKLLKKLMNGLKTLNPVMRNHSKAGTCNWKLAVYQNLMKELSHHQRI